MFKTSSKLTLKTRRQSMWSTAPNSIRSLSISDPAANDHSDEAGEQLESVSLKEEGEDGTKAGESFAQKTERIRRSSPYSHLPGWKLDGLICKSNDDLRQEVRVTCCYCIVAQFLSLL